MFPIQNKCIVKANAHFNFFSKDQKINTIKLYNDELVKKFKILFTHLNKISQLCDKGRHVPTSNIPNIAPNIAKYEKYKSVKAYRIATGKNS